VLTKPLGVGVITTALKAGLADPAHVAAAVASMQKLNRHAAQLIHEFDVHACTDVTGFALLGHAYEMAERSEARLRVNLEALPFLEGARAYAEENVFPGGACRNRDAYARGVDFPPALSEEVRLLLFTPETSGGLLLALPARALVRLRARFQEAGHPYWVIGDIVAGQGVEVFRT
jgi:selenide,water dikinase